jgi:outer membrane biosynthesis protein TonB
MFRATVAENGDVTEVKTLKAPRLEPACPDFEQAYRRAIAQWKYEPAKLHGRPVSVYLTITSLLEPR